MGRALKTPANDFQNHRVALDTKYVNHQSPVGILEPEHGRSTSYEFFFFPHMTKYDPEDVL